MKNYNLTIPKRFLIVAISAIFITVGCSKKDDEVISTGASPEDYDRTSLLANYANAYIQPAYLAYYNSVADLKTEVGLFNNQLTVASLQNLRSKWENALLIWQDVAFLEFGPAANISLRAQTNVYPADTSLIKSNITSGSYSLASGANYVAKGFQAIDFLINGSATNDADIVAYFSSTTNARIYLQDVVNELEAKANNVNNQWQGSFAGSFIANSASNAQGSSVSDIINALSQHYEGFIRKGKVGLPAGVFNGFSQQPMPQHVEAYYYAQSLPYLYRSLASVQKFINGESYISSTNGEGLADYLKFVNAQTSGQALETVIDNQLNTVQSDLANINDPFSNEVTVNNPAVLSVYQQMQMLVPYIKVDMTNALEVLITYQDTDGD